jgi:hypothetical protein
MLRRLQRKGNARKKRKMFEEEQAKVDDKGPSEINAQGMLARGCVYSQKRADLAFGFSFHRPSDPVGCVE